MHLFTEKFDCAIPPTTIVAGGISLLVAGSGVPSIPEESCAYAGNGESETGGMKLQRQSSFLREFGGNDDDGGGEGGEGKTGDGEDGEGYWGRQIDPVTGMAYYLNEKVTCVSVACKTRMMPPSDL